MGIRKLLIANRGEIACRVIRAAREMGIATVAVYSDADAQAAHTLLADEAVWIGGSEPNQSYLRIEAILEACAQTGADAVHPGYGFLSERAEFADACVGAGLIFVGPSAEAMRRLGAKIDAKQIAVANGVPVTPGYFEPGADDATLVTEAMRIGLPVMLKASAGGGGRGMRIVREESELGDQLCMARDEARNAFGDDAMMVEKLVERPRHIEVQVLADGFGNVACLFERECSIQRRHQKLIEESPSPVMTDTLWGRMQTAVRALILAAGYTNAGTVEFMLDPVSGEFYFLEVNARLQVEHPVTELVTGVDLVQWQLRIAAGERLELPEALMRGDRSALRGSAIEARVVAEDPAQGFLPSIGPLRAWLEPEAPGVRVDSGYGAGDEVTRFYDSLLAKVIVHGETRAVAVQKLGAALRDFQVIGVATNNAFLQDVLAHAEFQAGQFDTGFVGRELGDWQPAELDPDLVAAVMAMAETAGSGAEKGVGARGSVRPTWDLSDGWRLGRGGIS